MKLPSEAILSTSKITDFSFKEKCLHKVLFYHEFYIKREDGSTQTITEQDLPDLNPMDLKDLIQFLHGSKHKHASGIKLKVCKMLRESIQSHAATDPHLARELNINIEDIPPNMDLEGIEQIPSGTILEVPELGMVYKTADRKKRFFRVSESLKFSNSNLKALIKFIEAHGIGDKGRLVHYINLWMNSKVWAKQTWDTVKDF